MKKGFSALELLIIVAVLCFVLFFIFKGNNPVKSVVNEHKQMSEKQKVIDNQLKDIENAKKLRDERLKQDLERNY